MFDLKTLEPLGEIPNGGGNGAVVDAKSGHGFASSHPDLTMFDTKSMAMIRSIDPNADNPSANPKFSADGIYFDPSDIKNNILFAACALGRTPGQPPQPVMVILSARDGTIITKLPLAGASDGAAFNPKTMEAFSSQSNGTLTVVKETSPTTFEVEQNLQTMNGARTMTLDPTTGTIYVMSVERGPAPPAPAGGRGGQAPVIPGSFTILMIGK